MRRHETRSMLLADDHIRCEPAPEHAETVLGNRAHPGGVVGRLDPTKAAAEGPLEREQGRAQPTGAELGGEVDLLLVERTNELG